VLRRLADRLPAERRERAALGLLAVLLLAGAAARLWLMLSVRPALVGYADSYAYITAAIGPLFSDTLRPAGYPIFLRGAHALDANLSTTILLQHALGLGSALLLYLAARRVGLSRWWSLLPAAVLSLAGPQILIEHAPLTEAVFVFLQSAAAYAAVRAVGERDWAWALGTGLLAGATVTVRTLGLLLAGALVIWLVLASGGSWRRRLLRGGATAAAAAVVVVAYVVAQESETGYTGLTRAGGWNLYGRVAPFADCGRFTPPAGTRVLCEDTPEDERPGPNVYIFGGDTPAARAFGDPFRATEEENERVGDFARTALLGQPLDWLDHVITEDLVRYVASDHTARDGQGLSFDGLQDTLVTGFQAGQTSAAIVRWYSTSGQYLNQSRLDAFFSYERGTRVVGPLFVLLALLALSGVVLARGRPRAGAWLFTLLALVSILGPPATIFYDARYAIPAFGPLVAAAALGGAAISERLSASRDRPAATAAPARPGPR
jgi:Dolichyl-phosphate-mannose-protein mannosyltransferase